MWNEEVKAVIKEKKKKVYLTLRKWRNEANLAKLRKSKGSWLRRKFKAFKDVFDSLDSKGEKDGY